FEALVGLRLPPGFQKQTAKEASLNHHESKVEEEVQEEVEEKAQKDEATIQVTIDGLCNGVSIVLSWSSTFLRRRENLS
ncbi:hypothetical protein U1Q18_031203, partial [Sarracenia purpurea var. burkii]